ncbi:unnamed protein product, partial [Musa acuminata var. zebrina]
MASFEYHRSDPWFNKLFNDSMRRLSTVVIKVFRRRWWRHQHNPPNITSEHPCIKGINYNLPRVISE